MCGSNHVRWYCQCCANPLNTAGLASQGQSTGSKPSENTHASTAEAATTCSSNGGSSSSSGGGVTVRNIERRHWAQPWRKNSVQLQSPVCTLELPDAGKGWKGPRLNLSLPSFRCAWFCSVLPVGNSVRSLAAATVNSGAVAPAYLPVAEPEELRMVPLSWRA